MKLKKIKHQFVDLIPDVVEEGIFYISIQFSTATHKCACGCGNRVVTPIRPTDWSLTWNGDTITLWPSIGNWNFPCQSHYFIKKNKIIWARKMSDFEINLGRELDMKRKEQYFKKFQNEIN